MNSVTDALRELREALCGEFVDEPGLRYLNIDVVTNHLFDPLAWLASQPFYPQFFWQQRSGDEACVALGALCTFSSLSDAQDFLRVYAQTSDLRIWGLNAFNPVEGLLFLPRLEWRCTTTTLQLRLCLYSNVSLREDARKAAGFLDQLVAQTPLPSLDLTCIKESHFPEKKEWFRLIALATAAISASEMDKVVLARATDLHFSSPVQASALMAASRRENFSCYHYMLAFDAENAFLGSSPERLWRRTGTQLRTEALAGTVASHSDVRKAQERAQWLLKDDKNQRENMLVVEDICQRLHFASGIVDVLPPQVIKLRQVQHLRRCIWTELVSPDDTACLMQLQPTAAVAGLPREPARKFIAANEPFKREWYAGSAGYLSLQQTEFCVALRSARVTGQELRLYAGAGIVAGSDAAEEWQEIENKAAGLRTLLFKTTS